MFALAHLGIWLQGAKLVDRDPPLKPLLLGTLLPDLIDKPLYYVPAWATGKHGAELGIVCGTRTFGHTILLTAAVFAAGAARKSRALKAAALGMTTHLVLDWISEAWFVGRDLSFRASMRAFGWPFFGWQFPVYPFYDWHEHAATGLDPFMLVTESLGAVLLIYEWRRRRLLRR
jgi:hypothetical protein